MTDLRFATDADLLRLEPQLEDWFPRKKGGAVVRDWDIQHSIAMEEIERRLRARKDTPDMFELGRLGFRSREFLRSAAAEYALHFIFVACDSMGDPAGFFARKASYHYQRAASMFDAESIQLDYDFDNNGVIDEQEKQRPFPAQFIRG